jgi:hypothetical protein
VPTPQEDVFEGRIDPDAYEAAREAAPGWDTRHLEQEWRLWCGKEEIKPKLRNRAIGTACLISAE